MTLTGQVSMKQTFLETSECLKWKALFQDGFIQANDNSFVT